MTTLITGATGFVGSAIAGECARAGVCVRTTSRTSEGAGLPGHIAADLHDARRLPALLEGVTSVIHAAGLAHQFHRQEDGAASFERSNSAVTRDLAYAAAESGVRHFILLSSVAVYGPGPWRGCDEARPCQPVGPYARSKLLAEESAAEIACESGMPLTILRLATVYGEGDPGNIARLIRSLDRRRFIWIGSGKNRKSLIHRDDVGRACVAVLRAAPPTAGPATWNVSGPAYTMREIVDGIADGLRRSPPPISIPPFLPQGALVIAARLPGGARRTQSLRDTIAKWLADDVYETDNFVRAYGVVPQVALKEGLNREIAWYKRERERGRT